MTGYMQRTGLPLAAGLPVLVPAAEPEFTRWWDARSITAADNAQVYSWGDIASGTMLTPAGSGAAGRTAPLLRRAANGAPRVEFNGTTDTLGQSLTRAQPHTVFAVARTRTTSNPSNLVPAIVGHGAASTPRNVLGFANGKPRLYAGTALDMTERTWDTNFHVFLGVFNGATSVMSYDGYELTGNAGTEATSALSLALWDATSWQVDIQAVGFAPVALSAARRSAVVSRLTADWLTA